MTILIRLTFTALEGLILDDEVKRQWDTTTEFERSFLNAKTMGSNGTNLSDQVKKILNSNLSSPGSDILSLMHLHTGLYSFLPLPQSQNSTSRRKKYITKSVMYSTAMSSISATLSGRGLKNKKLALLNYYSFPFLLTSSKNTEIDKDLH